MSNKWKTVLLRLIRTAIAGAAGATVTVLPGVEDAFPGEWKPYAAIAIAALVVALDKLRRWGSDPFEA